MKLKANNSRVSLILSALLILSILAALSFLLYKNLTNPKMITFDPEHNFIFVDAMFEKALHDTQLLELGDTKVVAAELLSNIKSDRIKALSSNAYLLEYFNNDTREFSTVELEDYNYVSSSLSKIISSQNISTEESNYVANLFFKRKYIKKYKFSWYIEKNIDIPYELYKYSPTLNNELFKGSYLDSKNFKPVQICFNGNKTLGEDEANVYYCLSKEFVTVINKEIQSHPEAFLHKENNISILKKYIAEAVEGKTVLLLKAD